MKDIRPRTGRYVLGPLFLAIGLLIGCGGGTGASTKSSGSQPTLALSANTLDFGTVAVGASKTNSLALSNTSSIQDISVSAISVSGTGFSLSSAPTLPLVVAAGKSVTLTVGFAPKAAGSDTGNLSIQCDASNSSATVPLSGSGSTSNVQLSVTPTDLNFGSVPVGTSKSLTGTLIASSSSVTVSTADWSGQGYAVSGITFPKTVSAGQNVSFTVTFTPPTAGTSAGSVSFVSNASNSPGTETLTGNGTQATSHTVSLSWNPSTSTVVGYNVYRGTKDGGPYPTRLTSSPLAGTAYDDATVASGTTYFYVARAVDSNSVESPNSNQATAVVP